MSTCRYIADPPHIVLTVDIFPEADEFVFWAELFLLNEIFTIVEKQSGADRHQIRFRYKNQSFNLNYEHYSDSLWIAAEGLDAEQILPQLQVQLST